MTPKLFKFVASKDAVISMAGGRLKFASVASLNDPLELFPSVYEPALMSSLRTLLETGYSDAQFRHLKAQGNFLRSIGIPTAIQLPDTKEQAHEILKRNDFYQNSQIMLNFHMTLVKEIKDRVGILSLTENPANLPMWAHYANNAKGYVIEFEYLYELFPTTDLEIINKIEKIDYVEELIGMTFEPFSYKNLFFCKLSDWATEKEWRVIKPLKECTEIAFNNDTKIHCFDIPLKHIKSVMCGWNIAASDAQNLAREVRLINPNIEILQAYLDNMKVLTRSVEQVS